MEIKNLSGVPELEILSYIGEGGVTLKDVVDATKDLQGDELKIVINSPGGSVFEGIGIYNYLKNKFTKLETEILGLGASISSVIFLAGSTRKMNKGSMFMIHNPWTISLGDSNDLRKDAELLDKIRDQIVSIYSETSAYTKEELQKLMDDETWMTEEDALTAGFATEIILQSISAESQIEIKSELISQFKNTPSKFVAIQKVETKIEEKDTSVESVTNSVSEPIQNKGDKSMEDIVNKVPDAIQDAIVSTKDAFENKKTGEVLNAITTSGVTPKLVQEVLDVVAEFNPMRKLASVYTIKGDGIVPVPGVASGAWGAEGATLTPSDPSLTKVTFSAYPYGGVFTVTEDMLEDNFFNVKSFINQSVGGGIGEAEAIKMLGTGDGSGEPQGIFNKAIDTLTATTSTLAIADLLNFVDSLETKYRTGNEVFIMHPSVLSAIANLKDNTGKIELDRVTKTLFGVPYVLTSLAPAYATTANSKIIAYGDFKRGYGIAQRGSDNDRIKMKVVSSSTAMTSNVVYQERVDGRILDPDAFKILAIK